LSRSYQALWHGLLNTIASPLKIVLAYNGFASESGLREGFVEFLKKQHELGESGMAWDFFPHLIVDGHFSLIMTNFFPYSYATADDECCVYASSKANPITHLIDFLWTKIMIFERVPLILDYGLKERTIIPFIWIKLINIDSHLGWKYTYGIMDDELKKRPDYIDWLPIEVNKSQYDIMTKLCKDGRLSLNGKFFQRCVNECGMSPSEFITDLRKKGLIAIVEDNIILTISVCMCAKTSDGKYWCGENNDGKFSRWLSSKKINKKETQ
jgi:hypothetical protein